MKLSPMLAEYIESFRHTNPERYAKLRAAAYGEVNERSRVSKQELAKLTKRQRALKYLRLPLDATDKEIKKRYNELLKKYHPDTNGGSRKFERKLNGTIKAYKATKE